MSAAKAAVEVWRAGRAPVPLTPGQKRPNGTEWQRRTYADEAEVNRHFSDDSGLGLRLGDGLADVDLDDEIARRAARMLLPPTSTRSGREGSPASHWWYRLAEGSEHYVKHCGPDGSALVEVRAKPGHQTAIPPTVHPSGEEYRWEGEGRPWDAEEVPAADVLAGAASLALVAVLAPVWPTKGSRHGAYLALSGALLSGPDPAAMKDVTERVVRALARLSGDEEGGDARVGEAVPSTLRRLGQGGETTGWTTLAGLLATEEPEAVVKAAQKAADNLRDALGVSLWEVEIVSDDGPPPCDVHTSYPSSQCLTCERRRLWVREEGRRLHEESTSLMPPVADLLQTGSVVLDAPTEPVSIWGRGSSALQTEGEALMLVGPSGVGKTTLAQQYALRRMGARTTDLLGLPISEGAGKVLYLAMDRPQQAVRSLRRMVTEEDRDRLTDRLVIWSGPPPVDLTVHRDALGEMCLDAGADTVIVDSLKDVGGTVVDDEGGTGWNSARQRALVAGVAVLELHHNRKGEMSGLADVYGSAWLTNGAGSVLAVKGSPGDPIVRLAHLKQPADEVGPLRVVHNHLTGSSAIWDEGDVVVMAADSGPEGITAKQAARGLSERAEAEPDGNAVEKARRRLNRAVREGDLIKVKGEQTKGEPDRWVVPS